MRIMHIVPIFTFILGCEGGTAIVPDAPDADADTDADADADADADSDADSDADADPLTITSVVAVQDVTDLDLTVTFTGEDGPATLQVLVDGLISLLDVDVVGGVAVATVPIEDPCMAIPSDLALSASLDGATWAGPAEVPLAGRAFDVTGPYVVDIGELDGLVLACGFGFQNYWPYALDFVAQPGTYTLRAVDTELVVEVEDPPMSGNIVATYGPGIGDLGEVDLGGRQRLRFTPVQPVPFVLAVAPAEAP